MPASKALYRDVVALTAQTTFLSNKINFLLDATLGRITLEQNQIITIFSVAAVVFLPHTLVASIYGMHFESMPERTWLLGYPWAIGLMIGSAVLPYVGYLFNAGQLGYDCRYSKTPGMPVTGGHDFRGLKPLWHLVSRLKWIPWLRHDACPRVSLTPKCSELLFM